MSTPVLTVERLGVSTDDARAHPILHDVTFALNRGASVGLVGRSGAGKSTIGNAILDLLPRGMLRAPQSRILLGTDDLRTISPDAMRAVRGKRIAMVFQEPLTALNPAMPVGAQLFRVLRAHGHTADDARYRAAAMLERVGLANAGSAAGRFPHELSGGQRQRVLLALALVLEPEILIADEPTTALDPVLQTQLLDRLDALRAEFGTALVLISHDLELVAERCERVLAIEHGRVVADGPAAEVLATRRRPASPAAAHAAPGALVVEAEHVAVHFAVGDDRRRQAGPGEIRAVDGVSLSIAEGECLGIVGESGGGKTTLARALLGLSPLAAGRVSLVGQSVAGLDPEALRRLRKQAQLIPQDAGASLTPERTVEELIGEILEVHGLASGPAIGARVIRLLEDVGLTPALATRRPAALSTGERQRVAIARALAVEPRLLICDEPVANVDADSREHLLALLDRLRATHRFALLMISHDVDAVRRLASRVAVMYLGRIVEQADSAAPLLAPRMPYTQILQAALPTPGRGAARLLPRDDPPSRRRPAGGCPFEPRCPHPSKDARCRSERPTLQAALPTQPDHLVACWHDPLPPIQ